VRRTFTEFIEFHRTSITAVHCKTWIADILYSGVQPALHFGGATFMNFHSMTSLYLFNRGTDFRKRSQICSFRNISENENLLVLIRPVTRGAKPTLKFFSPPWKNVLDVVKTIGHSLKIWASPRKLFAPSGVVTGLL